MKLQLPMLLVWSVTGLPVYTTASHVALMDITRYFPDYTPWKDNFPCSEKEIECFKQNKLLFEADGRCYSVGEQGPCAGGEIFHADKAEAFRRGGHVRGTCKTPCPGLDHAPLAATGECMSRSEVQTKICRADLYLHPEMDVFAQWVCDWSIKVCPQEQMKSDSYPSSNNGLCSPPDIFLSSTESEGNTTVSDHIPDDHPLLRYFSNYTFLDREFPCTEEEKTCFQYGRILGSDGNCYSLNEIHPNCKWNERFNLDLDEANKEGGKLQWTCSPICDDSNEFQKDKLKCLDSYNLYTEICRSEWGMQATEDRFGRNTCKCIHSVSKPLNLRPSPPPISVTPGSCRLPDFSNPVESPDYDLTLTMGFEGPCSEEEFACLREGKVLAMGACYALRTRGPCAENEQLVLDKEALAHACLKPLCTPNLCPEGSVRVPTDGTCLTHQQAISLLCPQKVISLNEFGGWKCSYSSSFPGNLSRTIRSTETGICEIPAEYFESHAAFPSLRKFLKNQLNVGGNTGSG